MNFDEQPDGDIHGDEKLLVDTTMKMTVHAVHCNALLVAALEGLEVPSVDLWIGRQPAEIRALTSAICTQAKMANELEQQVDACRPYLKEGETAADAMRRLSERKTVRSLCEAYEACKPFLKDGETPAECLARNRADIVRLMGKWGAEKMTTARLRTALDKIAQTTGSDDPCRPLVQIARDALKRRSEAAGWQPTSTDPTHWMPLPAAPTTKEAT